jgi:nuclease EXOG
MPGADRITWAVCVGLVVSCGAGGCVKIQKRTIPALYAARSAGLTQEQIADFTRHCGEDWGVPEKVFNFGQTYYVNHDGYVMEYSGPRRIALWVSHYVPKAQLKTTFTGTYARPAWSEEEDLPAGVRALDDDYPFGGKPYNRGHMSPNADFGSKQGRDDTFILSNAVPQQWQHNQQIWETFEGYVRDWIEKRGEAYIITGGLLYDPKDDPQSDEFDENGDGVVKYDVMGDSEVTIPTHVFKIIIAPKSSGSDDWESLAVVLKNRKYVKGADKTFDDDLEEGLTSIDWIEHRAGLNFLPTLPDGSPEEQALESEAAKPAQLWAR